MQRTHSSVIRMRGIAEQIAHRLPRDRCERLRRSRQRIACPRPANASGCATFACSATSDIDVIVIVIVIVGWATLNSLAQIVGRRRNHMGGFGATVTVKISHGTLAVTAGRSVQRRCART